MEGGFPTASGSLGHQDVLLARQLLAVLDGNASASHPEASTLEQDGGPPRETCACQRSGCHGGYPVLLGAAERRGGALKVTPKEAEPSGNSNNVEHTLSGSTSESMQGSDAFITALQSCIGNAQLHLFFQDFQRCRELVDEANAIAEEVSPHTGLLFKTSVCLDFCAGQVGGRTCEVRLTQKGRPSALAVFEVNAFSSLVAHLRNAHNDVGGASATRALSCFSPEHIPHDLESSSFGVQPQDLPYGVQAARTSLSGRPRTPAPKRCASTSSAASLAQRQQIRTAVLHVREPAAGKAAAKDPARDLSARSNVFKVRDSRIEQVC